jgi:hypothetical protein
MDKRLEALQANYIEELRAVAPEVERWWQSSIARNVMKGHPKGKSLDFDTRWPAGKSSHPRLLAVFRKYFLQAEAINATLYYEAQDKGGSIDEGSWGVETQQPTREQVLPIELLVEDIEDEAPDLFEFVEGLVFIPIGDDDSGSTG